MWLFLLGNRCRCLIINLRNAASGKRVSCLCFGGVGGEDESVNIGLRKEDALSRLKFSVGVN